MQPKPTDFMCLSRTRSPTFIDHLQPRSTPQSNFFSSRPINLADPIDIPTPTISMRPFDYATKAHPFYVFIPDKITDFHLDSASFTLWVTVFITS